MREVRLIERISGVEAPPHDLLKVMYWERHSDVKFLPESFKKACPELTRIIRYHHKRVGWSVPDRLASAISRFRLEFNYWGHSGSRLDPFLVKIYRDRRIWPHERCRELWEKILSIYKRLGDVAEAHRQVNELLSDFPQDSRFPLISLRTHHWLTHILKRRLERGSTDINIIYVISISLPEPAFHRLKENREFFERRILFLKEIGVRASKWGPLRVGDDLYIVLVSEGEVGQVLNEVKAARMPCDIDIYIYHIENIEIQTRAGPRIYDRVRDYDVKSFSMGVEEEWASTPTERVEWIRYMTFPYVVWISVRPRNSLQNSAEEFLRWAEDEVLSKLPRVSEPESLKSDIPVCPELLLSVAEGYDEFLSEFVKAIDRYVRPESLTILRSFSRSLFIYGINNLSQAMNIYARLAKCIGNLHISTILTVVVARPKHPFWHILGLFDRGGLIFVVGGKMVVLSDEEVSLLREIAPTIRSVSRTQYYNILRKSKGMSEKELQLYIEGLAADNKISRDASSRLCLLIDELARRHKGGELKNVIRKALRALAPFTRIR